MVFLPFLLTTDSASVDIAGLKIPEICWSKRIFNFSCPGCGLTRSFVLITQGQFYAAFEMHKLGLIIYLFCVSQIFFRIYCLKNPGKDLGKFLPYTFSFIITGILIGLFVIWLCSFI
ncbi:MAG: DUF2752 domain-containing protein [Lentisphaeria bacterium]|nr:DUF2752 domain-containing protein [Lentisphaeria bacterium]